MPKWLRKWWWVPFLLFAAVDLAAHLPAWIWSDHGAEWKRSLEQAVQGTDRIVVDRNTWPGSDPDPAFQVKGTENVQAFLQRIRIHSSNGSCMCDGDLVFRFCEGEEEVAIVSYHHGRSLRWRGGPWPADAILTRKSRAAVRAWLNENG